MENKKEMIIVNVKETLRKYINMNLRFDHPKNKEEFYKSGLKELEYGIAKKYNFQTAKKRDTIYYEMVEEYGADLKAFIDETMMKTKKRLLQQEVNSTTAGIIINAVLEPEGIQYKVEMQTYRVKIYIKLNDTNKAVFCISYKKLNEGLEKLVLAVRQLQDIVSTFGRNTGIEMIHKWEDWG